MSRARPVLFGVFLALSSACEAGVSSSSEPPLPADHNPLGGADDEDPFLPFPSSAYLKADAQTPTGLRVALPAGLLPVSRLGKALDPAPYNRRDGFSPATRLIAYFPQALDEGPLIAPKDVSQSVTPGSPVVLMRYDTGERVPCFLELDKNANPANKDRQALLIQPVVRLAEKTRYVVALRGLLDSIGVPVRPLSGFAAIRDGRVDPQGPRGAEIARFAEIFTALGRAAVRREELQLAWDFVTGSDEMTAGAMVHMRDAAWAQAALPPRPQPFTISAVNDLPKDNIVRQLIGTFSAPSFLTDDAGGRLLRGQDGEPRLRGWGQFYLVVHVPTCVTKAPGPVPVMIYGHGLFGEAKGEMESEYQREIINRMCMVQVGTNWIGLAEDDLPYVGTQVIGDFNNFAQITERLQQAHINTTYLARLIASGELDKLPQLQLGGKLVLDSKRLYYYGISDGGIQGATTMALSPELSRGALNVPGGFWSMMMYRSADFQQYADLIGGTYPDAVDRQLLVVLTQPLWDFTDPATYAPHLLRDPLPGVTVKQVLYQEGLSDGQVPNVTTRAMVRTMGLLHVGAMVEPVYGIAQQAAPSPSGYVQFDIAERLPRMDNVPPPDNHVHEAIRRLEAAKEQLARFLKEGGQVEDTCASKPCVFPRM